jgi:hypothetical protein
VLEGGVGARVEGGRREPKERGRKGGWMEKGRGRETEVTKRRSTISSEHVYPLAVVDIIHSKLSMCNATKIYTIKSKDFINNHVPPKV